MKLNILFQIIPLVAGGMSIGAVSTTGETGLFEDCTVKGIPDGTEDYTFSISFKSRSLGYHDFYVVLSNSIIKTTPAYQNDSTYPRSYVIREAGWTKTRLLGGASKQLTIRVPRNIIDNTGNMFYFYNIEYTNSSFSSSSSYMKSTRLDVVKARNHRLPDSGTCFTNGGFSGFSVSSGTFKNNAYTIEHRGFEGEFINPAKNRLPFESMQIRAKNYLSNYEKLPTTSISLRIYSYLDSFSLWSTKTDGIRRWVEIPLSFYPATSSYFKLGLKEAVGVTIDGREMKPVDDMKPGDLLTTDLYLPSIGVDEVKAYSMQIIFDKCGDNMVDTITYNFEVYKTSNIIGSCSTSWYCLEEI